ncbi:MAG: hypothetical protein OSB19_04335 [Opitutaceae bacterium]|nr:hypothetical protein [Opitutaceae bacterium]
MKTTPIITLAIALSSFLFSTSLIAEDSQEAQLIELVPKSDVDKDGHLTPSEIWYAKSLSKGNKEAIQLAMSLIRDCYSPTGIDKAKPYGPLPGKKIKLFILSGQSNMVGQGLSAELPKKQVKPNERILMFEEGKWQPLRPLKPTFGPEIAFAHAMAERWPGETIGIVKQAVGGTGVLAWHPQWTQEKADLTKDGRKGNLWKALTDKVNAARDASACEVSGFVWQQGGKDMSFLVTAKDYLENLSALVKGLRKETGVADLPFVLGTPRSEEFPDDISNIDLSDVKVPGRPGAMLVVKAQWEAQRVLSPAKAIPLRSLPKHQANIHYNTEGILKLGELFAAGYLELTGE